MVRCKPPAERALGGLLLQSRVHVAQMVAQMRRMELPALVDSYVVPDGNRRGLSLG